MGLGSILEIRNGDPRVDYQESPRSRYTRGGLLQIRISPVGIQDKIWPESERQEVVVREKWGEHG